MNKTITRTITDRDVRKWKGLVMTRAALLAKRYFGLQNIPSRLRNWFSVVRKMDGRTIEIDQWKTKFVLSFLTVKLHEHPKDPNQFFKMLEQLEKEVKRLGGISVLLGKKQPLTEPIEDGSKGKEEMEKILREQGVNVLRIDDI